MTSSNFYDFDDFRHLDTHCGGMGTNIKNAQSTVTGPSQTQFSLARNSIM